MNLEPHQRQQLHEAICESFSVSDLERLVPVALGRGLERIAASGVLDDRVRELIDWTERRALTTALLAAACSERLSQPLMQELLQAALHWPACCEGGLTERDGRACCFASRDAEITYLNRVLARLKAPPADYLPVPADAAPLAGANARRAPDAAAALRKAVQALYPAPPTGAGVEPDPCEHDGRRALFLLLGDAGAGKTTTMRQAARLLAESAKGDRRLPLPICISLAAGGKSVLDQVKAGFGALGESLWAYLAHGRAVLLFDDLDAPNDAAGELAAQTAALFEDKGFAAPAAAACRSDACGALEKLRPTTLTLAPLDAAAQRRFLRQWMPSLGGEDAGGAALAKLAGGEDQLAAAEAFQRSTPLLELYSTPHLLRLFAERHADDAALPCFNFGRLIGEYVRGVLIGEHSRAGWSTPDSADALEGALGALAYALRKEGRQDAVPRSWALEQMGAGAEDAAALLDAAEKARLVAVGDDGVRFYTPLLADWFAAVGWRQVWEERREIAAAWPHGWAAGSPWDGPAVLLTGLLDADAEPFIGALLPLNPVLAARCIGESGAGPFEDTLANAVREALTDAAESRDLPFAERCAAGDALNYVGDVRRGVGVLRSSGMPDIDWRDVPEGAFVMGGEPYGPVREAQVEAFAISRFPITNAQFAAFVNDGGYSDKRRACWSDEGWAWLQRRGLKGPQREGGVHDLPNHPAIWVSCHEAEAFCCWLSRKLRVKVALSTEVQWEKAARGADGRRYPHGDSLTPDDANYAAAGMCATSAVGVFPRSESLYDVMDAAGNVWEWTAGESARGAQRAVRGGCYDSTEIGVRCASRALRAADMGGCSVGFRVVKLQAAVEDESDADWSGEADG